MYVILLNAVAPVKKIKYLFKYINVVDLATTIMFKYDRGTNLIPGCRHIDQLHLSGGQVVLKCPVFFFQQEILVEHTHTHTHDSHM